MPCSDCFALRQEFIAQKDFMSQWFDAFMKQFQSLEFQTLNLRQSMEGLTAEFRSEVSSKLQEFDVALYNQSAQIKSLQTCFKTVGNGPGRPSVTCLVGMGGEIVGPEFQQASSSGKEIRYNKGRPRLYPDVPNEGLKERQERLRLARQKADRIPKECKICKKTFVRKNYLKMHELTHSGKKPFECPHCDSAFLQRGDLRKHLLIHSGLRPYKCTVCERRFNSTCNLAKHKRTHSNEKPFVCAEPGCSYRCISKSMLTTHSIVHSKERPFDCNLCGGRFKRRSIFLKHQKTIRCWDKKLANDDLEDEETLSHWAPKNVNAESQNAEEEVGVDNEENGND